MTRNTRIRLRRANLAMRNGLALAKYFGAKNFQTLKKPEQKEELAAALKAALTAVEKEKNPDGTPFGEIIKSGKLPVTDRAGERGRAVTPVNPLLLSFSISIEYGASGLTC